MEEYQERVGRGVIWEWAAADMFARRSAWPLPAEDGRFGVGGGGIS